MKMSDAKKEIEDKLFSGAPLSFDAMTCALTAIARYLEEHGDSSIAIEISVPDTDYKDAVNTLVGELYKGLNHSDDSCVTEDSAAHIIFDGLGGFDVRD
jgi:hypothetical protein